LNIPLFIPAVITVIVAAIGVMGRRSNVYWWRGLGAIAVAIAMVFLAAGGGTLDDPSGDGLITRWIRSATNDGPAVALWAIAILVAGYGLIIFLIVTGIRLDNKARAGRPSAD
jgi:hypothetical protein